MSESGSPGRYQRTTNGLIGSMIVVVLFVVGFVIVRGATSRDLEVEPEPVDYLETVELARTADIEVVYPPALPAGWIATNVELAPGERPTWFLALLTDEGRFVGIRQEDTSAEDLLEAYVDEDVEEEPPVRTGGLVERWDAWSDGSGDHAYTAELGDDTVLVYGSASAEDQQVLLELLVTDTETGQQAGRDTGR